MSARRGTSLLDSFNWAFEGIIHVLRTQRNMRIHFLAAIVVLVLAIVVGVQEFELLALMIAISFVLITEMVNSAIEGAIDVATTSFDPMAKLAKDVAAGAVLIATVNAVAVGYVVFERALRHRNQRLLNRVTEAPLYVSLIALVVVVLVVIATKALTHSGTPLRGGLPSGHAAVAFAGWMLLTLVVGTDHRFLISTIAFVMALLVAQTRVEAGVHSALEVTYGSLIGSLLTLVLYKVITT
jgi:diacylglycerol kinase (ATP)